MHLRAVHPHPFDSATGAAQPLDIFMAPNENSGCLYTLPPELRPGAKDSMLDENAGALNSLTQGSRGPPPPGRNALETKRDAMWRKPQVPEIGEDKNAIAVSVCVCVEHLNRCKTSNPYCHSRGVQSTVETAPNEAIHLCWKQSLINSVYLLFQLRRYFCCNGTGLSR